MSDALNSVSDADSIYLKSNTYQQYKTLLEIENDLLTFERPMLVTFTFRYDQTPEKLEAKFHLLIRTLSRAAFKNAFKRYGKMIRCHAAFEADETVKAHIHAILERPEFISEPQFKSMVRNGWEHGFVRFENSAKYYTKDPSDFANYFLKMRTKNLQDRSYAEYILA